MVNFYIASLFSSDNDKVTVKRRYDELRDIYKYKYKGCSNLEKYLLIKKFQNHSNSISPRCITRSQ